jgi:hypothetical protein
MAVESVMKHMEPPDELQIRLLLRVPPPQRIQAMLEMQDAILDGLMARLRQQHPEMSDLERCRLMFKRLYRNG